jgi:hypothetical protein
MNFSNQTSYKAGVEASPLIITDCKTLTTAHGFEFAVPLSQIAGGLTNTTFSVRASRPNQLATKLILKDALGNTSFTFPEVNVQPNVQGNANLVRSGNDITVTGSVCSNSPSPIHIEYSFSEWNLKCRLKQVTNFPNFSDHCDLGYSGPNPAFLHDSTMTDRQVVQVFWYDPDHPSIPFRDTINLQMDADQLARHTAKYPVYFPNTAIQMDSRVPDAYKNALIAKHLKEVNTGAEVASFVMLSQIINPQGPGVKALLEGYLHDRAGSSLFAFVQGLDNYWDYYNVGEPYTPSTVAYPIDITKTVGNYLFTNYGGITKLIRRTMAYETPLGTASLPLGHQQVTYSQNSGCFLFPFSKTLPQITTLYPELAAYINAYLKANETPPQNAAIDSIGATMQQIPVDIRVFQNNVMIQHLLSTFGTNVVKIPTLGRGL